MSPRPGIAVNATVALVAGDRQADGIFPLWSIAENISACSLRKLRQGALISRRREDALASFWRDRIKIRTPDIHNNILSLRRQPAEGAVCARARVGGAHRADGRPDARRRDRHQARSL